jgi:predicted membrane channel-forming protein YqfA (hemolysin III family)
MKRFVLPDNFGFRKVESPASTCGECEPEDLPYGVQKTSKQGRKNRKFAQYDVDDLSRIWYRVVCVNDRIPTESSYLGPTGHIERANVWTHMAAAFIYILYSILRPFTPIGEVDTVSSSLAAFAYASFVITFVFSSCYHVYSANRFWSAATRLGDYFGIYLGIAAGTLSDLSVVTENLKNVSWAAIADTFIGMAILVTFFGVRRLTLTVEETRLAYLVDKCTLGFARNTNVDLEHSSLRAAAGTVMAFSWVLTIPGAFSTLEIDCAWIFAGSRFLGTAVLITGMVLDNAVLYPDNWFSESEAPPRNCVCYSKREGCGGGWIMTSHAFWHILALASTIITTIGTEYVVFNSEVLKL